MSVSWLKPKESAFRTGLHIYNSLTQSKDEFFPNSGDRRVYWYMCGPTVYCDTHMGHARTYITSDIIRRVMTDYFGYQVTLCMNITNIDDKIINAAHEQSIPFESYANSWEEKFFIDMEKVNVRRPDILTRVTEYVPDIVNYTQKIIENGFGYISNGSVYFDTLAFTESHKYPKLSPDKTIDLESLEEAEGNLKDTTEEKKRPNDFALWKKSKPHEPFWPAPFGEGRPGWHIECSVMASDVLPCPLDIHSGGIDLRFPHHDNEIAQCEAFYGCQQWVNYFLHTGHLHIHGRKMSRSLKNFITIKEILEIYSARQLRMFFLLHKWDGTINYSDTSLNESIGKEKQFNEFLMNTAVVLRTLELKAPHKLSTEDKALYTLLQETEEKVYSALCDNFSTDVAVELLSVLVNRTNVYLKAAAKYLVVLRIRDYVEKMLKIFGLDYSAAVSQNDVAPVMDLLSSYRDQVRLAAGEKKISEIFKASDLLRDEHLPKLGFILEDRGKEPSIWKKADPEDLRKEENRKAIENEEKAKNEQAKKGKSEENKKGIIKSQKNEVKAEDLFKDNPKYSAWDENGLPTLYADGNPISKTEAKKLKKIWDKQKSADVAKKT
jgi:cysteinyl-tRNA synthetase